MIKIFLLAFGFIMPIYGYIQHVAGEAGPSTYILVGMAAMLMLDVLLQVLVIVFSVLFAGNDRDDR